VASRKEQKERARAERMAKEQAAKQEASRRRRVQIGAALGGLALIAVVVVVIVIASGGGDSGSSSKVTYRDGSVPASADLALQDTPPPWKPQYKQLQERIDALGLPGFNETTFHIHAHLEIFVDGKQEPVPANIGVDANVTPPIISPLHTHPVAQDNPEGTIHMEADQEYEFTLGQLMNVWGVKFSDNQIGSLKAQGPDKQLQVYVNGKPVTDPVNLVMQEHDVIVIGYGKPDSFPHNPSFDWPQGL